MKQASRDLVLALRSGVVPGCPLECVNVGSNKIEVGSLVGVVGIKDGCPMITDLGENLYVEESVKVLDCVSLDEDKKRVLIRFG